MHIFAFLNLLIKATDLKVTYFKSPWKMDVTSCVLCQFWTKIEINILENYSVIPFLKTSLGKDISFVMNCFDSWTKNNYCSIKIPLEQCHSSGKFCYFLWKNDPHTYWPINHTIRNSSYFVISQQNFLMTEITMTYFN